MNDIDQPDWLRKHLDTLPAERSPSRDLWPEIARRLDQPRRAWVPMAVAASLVISVGSALFTWESIHQRQEVAAMQVVQTIESPYLPARLSYEQQWPALRKNLDPQTAEIIERNVAIIRKANDELAEALRRHPADPALQRLLRQTLAQEVDVYQRARDAARGSI